MAGFTERLLIYIDTKVDGAVKGIRDVESAAEKAGGNAGPLQRFRGALQGAGIDASAMAKTAGLAVAGFVASGVSKFSDLTQQVLRVKQVSGETAEQASKLVAVADDFGVSAETVGKAMAKLAQGGATDTKAKLIEVANAFAATTDPAERAKIGTQAFGKSWQDMAVLLDQGGAKIEEAFAGVSDAQIFNDDELKKGQDLRLAMDNIKDAIGDLALKAGEDLVPALTDIANAASDVIGTLDDFGLVTTAMGAAIGGAVAGPLGALAGALLGLASKEKTAITGMVTDLARQIDSALAQGMSRSHAKETIAGLKEAFGEGWETILPADVTAKLKATAGEVKLLSGSFTESGRQARDMAIGIDRSVTAAEAQKKAAEEAAKAEEEHAKQQQALADALTSSTDAVWAQVDAERAAAKAADAAGEAIKDARDAQWGNWEANDKAVEAIEAAAKAAGDAAQKQAEMAGATDGAAQNVSEQIAYLNDLRSQLGPDSPLFKAVDDWIKKLQSIPANIATNISVNEAVAGRRTGARASGGAVNAGGMYLVGENGPEMLQMGTSPGTIIPNGALRTTGGGGQTIVLQVRGGVIGTLSDMARLAQTAARDFALKGGTIGYQAPRVRSNSAAGY